MGQWWISPASIGMDHSAVNISLQTAFVLNISGIHFPQFESVWEI